VARQVRGGIYVGKHNFYRLPSGRLIYHEAKASGLTVLHHAEEGAVFAGDEEAWAAELERVLDPGELAPEDHILTWGDFQACVYGRSNPPCAPNIQVVGHPRFDLCRERYRDIYREDAARIRKRF